jgi:DNA-binding beta-propeller fold protein YncE
MVENGDGAIFLTEFRRNRISKCDSYGYITDSFGQTGRNGGELVGPQYICMDDKGYLYVTEVGNRRVSKFDENGNFILSFGERSTFFEGFFAPSGIIEYRERIYVADNVKRSIFVFDRNGNYITTLADGMLNAPEDITVHKNGRLLIADTNRIVELDIEKEVVTTLSEVEGKATKLLSSAVDANENLLTVDFNNEHIFYLSELSNLYGGLTVRVDRVYSDMFPDVRISVDVRNREGQPIVGLNNSNFIVTENHRPVSGLTFEFASHQANSADLALLVEKSDTIQDHIAAIRDGIEVTMQSLETRGSARVVLAEEQPAIVAAPSARIGGELSDTLTSGFSEEWRFDLGLRMAASELIPSRNKKAVVYISSGRLGENAFEQYNLVELKHYLINNNITFYCIYVTNNVESADLEYLCRETGGDSYFLYRPEGVGGIVDTVLAQKNGVYVLSYSSSSDTEFGEAYIPVEVEVFLFKKSGRDESGYFAPLEF